MAADPIEGMARAIEGEFRGRRGIKRAFDRELIEEREGQEAAADYDEMMRAVGRAAWAYALATLRAPGGAHLTAYYDSRLFLDTFATLNQLQIPISAKLGQFGRDSGAGGGSPPPGAPTPAAGAENGGKRPPGNSGVLPGAS